MKTAHAIKATSILSKDGDDYVVESPLCPMVIGVGDTPEEAYQVFNEILDDYIDELKKGRIAQGAGRPIKPVKKTRLDATISQQIKEAMTQQAKAMGISRGELVEYLFTKDAKTKTQ